MGHINSILSSLEKAAKDDPYVVEFLIEFNKFASELGPEYQPKTNRIVDLIKQKERV